MLVAEERVELPCTKALVSKTSVSANSTTRPNLVGAVRIELTGPLGLSGYSRTSRRTRLRTHIGLSKNIGGE